MTTTLRLLAADLRYPPDLQVHTAISGPVDRLAELYLVIEGAHGFVGVGEVRANIAFLTKLPEQEVPSAILDFARTLPWSMPAEEIIEALPACAAGRPNIARAAVESALLDGLARNRGSTVAEALGGTWQPAVETNQCLFWSPQEIFERLAERYVGEGFRKIKLRIAIGDFAEDLTRLRYLRERYGDRIRLAVDANGSWTAEEAVQKLAALEPFDLDYVEQPTRPGEWPAFEGALGSAPMPLMLDEGLIGPPDIERLARLGPRALAHLKVVKLGGPMVVMEAARILADAGVAVMIGQMNEGSLATAMAAHCAMAARPRYAELYGCYGLSADVGQGLVYSEGHVLLPKAAGLGVEFDAGRCRTLWVETTA